MILKNRNIVLFFILVSTILFPLNFAYAQSTKTNVTVKMNKPKIIMRYWIVDTRFDKDNVKCKIYKPPDMMLTKKPEFGKVKFKKGVVIDNNKLSGDDKKYCQDKVIKATTAEFTSDKKGKTSFKIQVYYRSGRYEEHVFGNYLFNVNVR